MNRRLFLALVLYRLLNMCFIRTWYVPDEYWQSQEVAHKLAFGYGYLTWEWKIGLRSYIYPLILSIFYKLTELILALDQTILLVYTSPILHSILTAAGDYIFYSFCKLLFYQSKSMANKALYFRLASWYIFYTSPRSLSNNLEEFFTILILYTQQKQQFTANSTSQSGQNYFQFHFYAFLSFVFRSTAAINLVPIYVYQFFFLCKSKLKFLAQFVLVGSLVMTATITIDTYFHGNLLVSSFNFFYHNFINNVGLHYGTHAWHWYLSQGFPTLLVTHLAFFMVGLFKHWRKFKFEMATILFNIFIYSLLGHKEFRFLHQTLPFSFVICAYGLDHLERNYNKRIASVSKIAFLIINLSMAIFLGLFHQSAPISLMYELRGDSTLNEQQNNPVILFLTPCHSTPYYSFIHRNLSMRFLTCEPNLNHVSNYIDEADIFYADSNKWLQTNRNLIENAKRIVIFKSLFEQLKSNHLIESRFGVCRELFNSLTPITSRVDTKLLILCSKQ